MSSTTLLAEVSKEIFYNNDFGVYAFIPSSKNRDSSPELNKFGNFTVSGQTFRLNEGMEYELTIKPTWSKKYGDGLGFVAVKQDRPTSASAQHTYIRMMLTEKEAEAIIAKYPNEKILDLMQAGKFDYSEIKGIGEYTYNKIYKRLIENLEVQEALVALKDLHIDYKIMKKLISHFGSPQLVVQNVEENIYSLCKVRGFGFKKVDKWALNRGDSKENHMRIMAGIDFIISAEESEGHCFMPTFSAIEKARELLEVNRALLEEVVESLSSEDFYRSESGDTIARRRTYDAERNIVNKLFSLQSAKPILKLAYSEEKLKGIEEEQGFRFTEEQKTAIKTAVENNVFIMNGKGGVGKTATLKGILAMCNNYNHAACALSGKASKVLAKNGLNAKTIHRLLGFKDGGFGYSKDNPLDEHIIVVDETSMVNIFLFNSLISAIKDGYKLIIVGDSGQLASIGCGAVFRDLVNNNRLPRIELTKVQRQAQKSGILESANEVYEGNQIIKSGEYGSKVHGELRDFTTISLEDKDQILNIVCDIVEKKFANMDLYDYQVITGRKKDADISAYNLNLELQKIINPMKGNKLYRNGYNFFKGDKVIQNGNNYDAIEDVLNGTLGVIKEIRLNVPSDEKGGTENLVYIDFEDIGETIIYSEEDLDMIELAYAISCHRSQGSTIKYVLFAFDYSAFKLLSRQFAYTGISRASTGGVMISELSALRYAIKQDVSDTRRTFMKDMLKL
ncbi:ATP-dependent DNA helicase [Bacillus sp. Marseille-P3800]|uniref:ATP-dependent DNA helicase n=1 Tax=Bacillus sp. Marseille-P3800 TaxID=2014782 RepID=UPI000C0876C7|nr:ATP-dependent RecD-like DNA helicase [Bacillus sp. Marseille-P3800]